MLVLLILPAAVVGSVSDTCESGVCLLQLARQPDQVQDPDVGGEVQVPTSIGPPDDLDEQDAGSVGVVEDASEDAAEDDTAQLEEDMGPPATELDDAADDTAQLEDDEDMGPPDHTELDAEDEATLAEQVEALKEQLEEAHAITAELERLQAAGKGKGDLGKVGEQMKEFGNALKEQASAAEELQEQWARGELSIDDLADEVDGTASRVATQDEMIEVLRELIEQSGGSLKEMDARLANVENANEQLDENDKEILKRIKKLESKSKFGEPMKAASGHPVAARNETGKKNGAALLAASFALLFAA